MTVEKQIVRLTYSENNVYSLTILPRKVNLLSIGLVVVRESETEWFEENLIGDIDDSNKTFTTTFNYLVGSCQVHINGLLQQKNIDYIEGGTNTITFDTAPSCIGFFDNLFIRYRRL